MKKKIFIFLVSIMLICSLIPASAFADTQLAPTGHKVTFKFMDASKMFTGDDIVVRVDYMYNSGNEVMKSVMTYLEYDANTLTPLAAPTLTTANTVTSATGIGENSFSTLSQRTANNYQPAQSAESETVLYEKIDNNKGYMCWKVSDLRAANVRTKVNTRVSSVFFKVNKTSYATFEAFMTAINTQGQSIFTVVSDTAFTNNAAGLNASCKAQITATVNGKTVSYFYSPVSTLNAKYIDATLAGSNFAVEAKKYQLGDVNQDGSVNSTDLQRLYTHLQGTNLLSDIMIGDINQDGSTNSTDLQRLYTHLQGTNLLQQ